ncbi:phage/plasmid replication protein [Mannheimia sp. E30BD]|uniref:phage/plasmid replication domain-containing protein n=1 Tax=Mannheimia sp. E30BD TaxID=3278708 RepID=UPI00359DD4DF
MYHFDWLSIEQDHGFEIPESVIASLFDFGVIGIHLDTGEIQQGIRTGKYRHKGSYCDEVSIQVSDSTIKMEGNPSRWGKTENLLGFTSIDACVHCFNNILAKLKLPLFTRCTEIFHGQGKDGEKVHTFSNGAIIKRLDITTNKSVGKGNERTFIKALSQMRYRNSIGRLHTNGCTADWLSAKGNANLIYPSCYIKHEELRIHSYDKIKNKFGEHSSEFQYYKKVYDYCEQNGVVRFEQKLKSRYLKRENLCYWGLSDFSKLEQLQEEFINMHKNLGVSKIELQTIAEQLVNKGVVDTLRKANTTAFYAMKWASGEDMNLLPERTFKRHRSLLRKIGIDIANPCDVEKFQAVQVISCEQIFVRPFKAPDFYQYPSNTPILRLVA